MGVENNSLHSTIGEFSLVRSYAFLFSPYVFDVNKLAFLWDFFFEKIPFTLQMSFDDIRYVSNT